MAVVQLTGQHVTLDKVSTFRLLNEHVGSSVDSHWIDRFMQSPSVIQWDLVQVRVPSDVDHASYTLQCIAETVWIFTGRRLRGEHVEFQRVPVTKRLIFEYLGGTEPRFFDSTSALEESISTQLLSFWNRSLDFGVVWSSGLAYRGTTDVSDLRPVNMIKEHVQRIAHIRAGLTRPEDMSDDIWKMVASDLDCCALWNRFLHTHEMS